MATAAGATGRYEELGLAEALLRSYDYPSACHELAVILRSAYARLPKHLQPLVLRDTLSAFRLLPDVQSISGISSAHSLLQAAEAVLPRQKKAIAVSEFKHAMVAHKRRSKAYEHQDLTQIPSDVLVDIFKYLDLRSLVTVGLVCREWNAAASVNSHWKMQNLLLFGGNEIDGKCDDNKRTYDKYDIAFSRSGEGPTVGIDWREIVRSKFQSKLSWAKCNRASCEHCKSILWLSNVTLGKSHQCTKSRGQQPKMRPFSAPKVVEFLLRDDSPESAASWLFSSSSDSDTDSEELSPFRRRHRKLWTYPRLEI